MSFEPILSYLEEEIGLSRASANDPVFSGAISRGLERSGHSDVMAYLHLLTQSEGEKQTLVQELLVPETWFFREVQSLTPLLKAFRSKRWETPIRILSAPCSTGEEPYTLSMLMRQHGVSPEHYQIEGLDLSSRAVESARRGVFHENSFRGPDRRQHQKGFFQFHSEGWKLDDRVRGDVTFRVANLLDPEALEKDVYHAIICRNLLIYLSERARSLVLSSLYHALREDGLLILGVAEAAIAKGKLFRPHGTGVNPVFEKSDGRAWSAPTPRRSKPRVVKAPPPLIRQEKPVPVPPPPPAPEPESEPELTVEQVRTMADSGQLVEARAAAQKLLEGGAEAELYYLLGLISTALGNDGRAEEELRRAVYLDPEHGEALLCLALLYERKGELGTARTFHRRSQEVKS